MGLPVTDEPEVTADTRFWLFFEVRDCVWAWTVREVRPTHGEPLRIKVEVTEQDYRRAHREAFRESGDDFTMPLDDHWWHTEPLPTSDPHQYRIHRTRGGYIDWWGS